MPKILQDILANAILGQSDLELIRDGLSGPRAVVDVHPRPDVVILGGASPADSRATASRLLGRWPQARVLIITPAQGEASLCELSMQRSDLGRLSPAEVVEIIRAGARRER